MAQLEFRSPLRKLVAFFKASRDKWKEKCQQTKYELKLLKRRFENLQISRDQWQQCYQQAETQREQLQAPRRTSPSPASATSNAARSLAKKGEHPQLALPAPPAATRPPPPDCRWSNASPGRLGHAGREPSLFSGTDRRGPVVDAGLSRLVAWRPPWRRD